MSEDDELVTLREENADLNKQLDALERSRLEVLELLEQETIAHNSIRATVERAIKLLRQSVEPRS